MTPARIDAVDPDIITRKLDGGIAERRSLAEWVSDGITGFAFPGDLSSLTLRHTRRDSVRTCATRPRVDASAPAESTPSRTAAISGSASALPSSTPHWSNELIPYSAPSTKVRCS